ncbi:MAG: CPBP family glutamic-type intramembrane protease [Myxococcota bacterium]|nr:CPBP family glutamic-type intramembrane protease [Myxococcota bacterium]MDW8361475.1 CPBP family glutamic-type intramembrane protease [Myxococcales bacterium]
MNVEAGTRTRTLGDRLRSKLRAPLESVAFTVPAFVVYHVAVPFLDVRNGVDWVTGAMMRLLDASLVAYLACTVGVGVVLTILARRHAGPDALRARRWALLFAESTAWAVGTFAIVGGLASRLLDVQTGVAPRSLVEVVATSLGAGFHEELVFRAGLFDGGRYLLRRYARLGPWRATAIAAFGSAALFALAHHAGPTGEPLAVAPLLFRTLAGLYLTAIYAWRGFAVAVWSHALYDVLWFTWYAR